MIKKFGKTFNERIENAASCLREGKGIILVDDENRENEGDIIFPASTISAADMALMIRECSGIICLCLSEKKCMDLNLPQMTNENTSRNQTAFTISIEAKEGVTTGVSALDRVHTIRTAIAPQAVPENLARPGHVFPLQGRNGGVFSRRGHTEGSMDIVKIAGLGDAAVLCELTNIDGTMSRLPEICRFADSRDMAVLSVEDIYQYRMNHDSFELNMQER